MRKIISLPRYLVYESNITYKKKDIFPFDNGVWFKCSRTKKELIAYTQFHKTDWVNIIRGPTQFVSMSPKIYNKCLEVLNQDKIVIYAKVPWLSQIAEMKEFMKNKKVKKYYEG